MRSSPIIAAICAAAFHRGRRFLRSACTAVDGVYPDPGACQKAGKFSVSSIKDNGTQKLQLRARTVLVWSCGVVETPGCHLTSWPHRRIRRGSIPIKAQRWPDRTCESTQVYSQHRCQAAWL
ncbi:hypothetical protein SKAU_G00178580 [Synaphobranchus kaupii]|uniref:Uncharacterized protein n=1 Tax=Synaphobranchus kaupii TaxID=118154 RepID=A0A9Q1FM62_SYNKA|nr:hypothetical protein SKAU_G00178580 [Synaphobranchus kaupii]